MHPLANKRAFFGYSSANDMIVKGLGWVYPEKGPSMPENIIPKALVSSLGYSNPTQVESDLVLGGIKSNARDLGPHPRGIGRGRRKRRAGEEQRSEKISSET